MSCSCKHVQELVPWQRREIPDRESIVATNCQMRHSCPKASHFVAFCPRADSPGGMRSVGLMGRESLRNGLEIAGAIDAGDGGVGLGKQGFAPAKLVGVVDSDMGLL